MRGWAPIAPYSWGGCLSSPVKMASAVPQGAKFLASAWPAAPVRALVVFVVLLSLAAGGVFLSGPLGPEMQTTLITIGSVLLGVSLLDLVWRPQEIRVTSTELLVLYPGRLFRFPLSRITSVRLIEHAQLPAAIPLWPLGWRGPTAMMGRHWVSGKGVWSFHCQRPTGRLLVIETLRGTIVVSPDQPVVLRDRLEQRLRQQVLGHAG